MDLGKMQDSAKLSLCKFYFKIGFLCLPFLWLVNAFWFFEDAFQRQTYPEQKSLRKYVIFSVFGGTAWLTGIAYWVYTYQVFRYNWGIFGEQLSFTLPTGEF